MTYLTLIAYILKIIYTVIKIASAVRNWKRNKKMRHYHIDSEILSPEDFLALTSEERKKIRKTEIVPPKIGDNNFGGIKVFYRFPIYGIDKRK